jgi:hypothetical protein
MNAMPTTPYRVTVADLARANNVNPKIARRRLRDQARRAAQGVSDMPNLPHDHADGRLNWESHNRTAPRVLDIILPC